MPESSPIPLSIPDMVARLGAAARRFDIDILASCDSTNTVALARAAAGAPCGTVVVAEEQTAGRGRRGRVWFAARGDSLTFSLVWRFAPRTDPSGLSLAVGVAVARALAHAGCAGIALKWPNDILLRGRKLGGILVDLLPGAAHVVVIGIGLNLRLPPTLPAELRQVSAAFDAAHDPNDMLAALLGELLEVLEGFAAAGFAAVRDEWTGYHAHQDAPIALQSDFAEPRHGICRGADRDGALLFEVDGAVERVLSGEVSLRRDEKP